ncbi:nucleotide exchange factor GrpE [Tanticharoenia sakaeratensis]|uniref:Protein GrpE n=1 Tax=Tanticharoenia sakaeratensis NBRC 103193 TaxID=1231623 RepID=A0A0D6MMN8_9PROT|nr:nucleotide exchange factor GrpE [Tanticharoenia sakaeratensis]GAN54685.1 heat shock protein GrpE [Tanticharoenia sakaeratensis NBRC 103193]GBQ16808.1 heat shock protein GrpE [Tanticharoenia sakaeratensis NBRC 103193]
MNHETETPIEPAAETQVETPASAAGADSSEATMQAATARIQALEEELAEMRDRWMRSEAEMQNLRARTKRDVEDARQYAVQKFARDVVEAAENMKRGISSLPAQVEGEDGLISKLRDGFHSIERSFVGVLERHGIVGHDPEGAPFDANLHQAMAEQPSDAHAPGTVMQAWTPAWTLHGRLLKPAMVVVAKAPAEGGAAAGASPKLDQQA